MDNSLKVFNNTEFGSLGILIENDKELFPATECATILGYTNPRDAIIKHCRCIAKRDVPHPQNKNKIIEMNFIPEGDLYRLIARSKLPAAEKFESWVFDEVLPSIRKHGMFATKEKLEEFLQDPDVMIQTLQALKAEREKVKLLSTKVEEDKPMVLFAQSVESSNTSILVGELAKLLKQNGVDIGQNRLFEILRSDGYLIKSGDSRNMPTQRSMEMKLFEIKESTVMNADGSVRITKTTKVTGKGQIYFINLYSPKRQYSFL